MPATAPLASANRPVAIGSREWLNQLVADSLMVSLDMEWAMDSATCGRCRSAGSRNRGTLVDRPHEPLRMRVAVETHAQHVERQGEEAGQLVFSVGSVR